MANLTQSTLCPDWVWSEASNVHVAKDKEWFTSYTPFKSLVNEGNSNMLSTILKVEGVGTVEIACKIRAKRTGNKAPRVLLLQNVLHAPTAFSNVIGSPLLKEYDVHVYGKKDKREDAKGEIKDKTGKVVSLFEPNRFMCIVKLKGPPVGPVVGHPTFQPDELNWVSEHWPATEILRWEVYNEKNRKLPQAKRVEACHLIPPLTAKETKFIKSKYFNPKYHFQGEFQKAYDLSMDSEEDFMRACLIIRELYVKDASRAIRAKKYLNRKECEKVTSNCSSCMKLPMALIKWINDTYDTFDNFLDRNSIRTGKEINGNKLRAVIIRQMPDEYYVPRGEDWHCAECLNCVMKGSLKEQIEWHEKAFSGEPGTESMKKLALQCVKDRFGGLHGNDMPPPFLM